jgi:nitrite reductase/ring-hydroxylating ferredoxin subunit/uncharacterized membrane protein
MAVLARPLARLIRRIETAEQLERAARPLATSVSSATSRAEVKNALSGSWLGHQLHPLLTDVPIGSFVGASLLDLVGGSDARTAARRLVGFGLLSALPTVATGLSDWSETYGEEQRVGLVHGLGTAAGLALEALSYLARKRGREGMGRLLGLAGLGSVAAAGYLGGHLSFVRGVGVNHTAFEHRTSQWTDVAALEDLAPDEPVRVVAHGVPVLLVRSSDRVHALSATCTHAGGPLDEGTVTDGCVRCPWHGSTFRLADGGVVRGPASVDQPCWEVRTRDGRVELRSA